MTTTPQVDLAEARKLARQLITTGLDALTLADVRINAANALCALADEVEVLRIQRDEAFHGITDKEQS